MVVPGPVRGETVRFTELSAEPEPTPAVTKTWNETVSFPDPAMASTGVPDGQDITVFNCANGCGCSSNPHGL
jgi:hypothetical protein